MPFMFVFNRFAPFIGILVETVTAAPKREPPSGRFTDPARRNQQHRSCRLLFD
jgi:hypothetical protein